jgi:hypothetical protein
MSWNICFKYFYSFEIVQKAKKYKRSLQMSNIENCLIDSNYFRFKYMSLYSTFIVVESWKDYDISQTQVGQVIKTHLWCFFRSNDLCIEAVNIFNKMNNCLLPKHLLNQIYLKIEEKNGVNRSLFALLIDQFAKLGKICCLILQL